MTNHRTEFLKFLKHISHTHSLWQLPHLSVSLQIMLCFCHVLLPTS